MAGAIAPAIQQAAQQVQPVTGNIPDYTRPYIDNLLRQMPQQPMPQPMPQPVAQPSSDLMNAINNAGGRQPMNPNLVPRSNVPTYATPYINNMMDRPQQLQPTRGPADRNIQPVVTQGLAGLMQGRK